MLTRIISSLLYNSGISLYGLLLLIAGLWNKKAAKLVSGQRKSFEILTKQVEPGEQYIWFHAASLGEFEQGRPVVEQIKKNQPDTKILLTFFSPSGYEVRKNYPGADLICYLPLDTRKNARRFLQTINISKAIFIKYEFWPNYLTELKKRDIPVFLISAIFRPKQVFFSWYGTWYKALLKSFRHIFVQDENSLKLLQQNGINAVSLAGDSRFDRVADVANQARKIPLIEAFINDCKKVIVAGSSWPKDEFLLVRYMQDNPDVKLILVPHEIHDAHIRDILKSVNGKAIRYSTANKEEIQHANCMVVDTIGLLSSIYQYAQVAYIGGGFGVGIHNTLEAAVWNVPVVFGPNYQKFREARELITEGGGFSINNYNELKTLFDSLLSDKTKKGNISGEYVRKNTGATKQILKHLS